DVPATADSGSATLQAFTLQYAGQNTIALPFDVDALTLQTELNKLLAIKNAGADVGLLRDTPQVGSVTVTALPASVGSAFLITFGDRLGIDNPLTIVTAAQTGGTV